MLCPPQVRVSPISEDSAVNRLSDLRGSEARGSDEMNVSAWLEGREQHFASEHATISSAAGLSRDGSRCSEALPDDDLEDLPLDSATGDSPGAQQRLSHLWEGDCAGQGGGDAKLSPTRSESTKMGDAPSDTYVSPFQLRRSEVTDAAAAATAAASPGPPLVQDSPMGATPSNPSAVDSSGSGQTPSTHASTTGSRVVSLDAWMPRGLLQAGADTSQGSDRSQKAPTPGAGTPVGSGQSTKCAERTGGEAADDPSAMPAGATLLPHPLSGKSDAPQKASATEDVNFDTQSPQGRQHSAEDEYISPGMLPHEHRTDVHSRVTGVGSGVETRVGRLEGGEQSTGDSSPASSNTSSSSSSSDDGNMLSAQRMRDVGSMQSMDSGRSSASPVRSAGQQSLTFPSPATATPTPASAASSGSRAKSTTLPESNAESPDLCKEVTNADYCSPSTETDRDSTPEAAEKALSSCPSLKPGGVGVSTRSKSSDVALVPPLPAEFQAHTGDGPAMGGNAESGGDIGAEGGRFAEGAGVGEHDAEWQNQSKHIFVLTSAGASTRD